jgi:Cu-Zn family superoxide dismutase
MLLPSNCSDGRTRRSLPVAGDLLRSEHAAPITSISRFTKEASVYRMLVVTAFIAVSLAGCAALTPAKPANTATAELRDPEGRPAGSATLTEVPGGVRVVVEAKGMPPGPHGVHIHEVGKCEGPQFTSAGSHFNPDKKQHGTMNPQGPHAGDLPNLTIGPDGSGRLEVTTPRIALAPSVTSVFDADGSAIVVHAGPDDLKTDPTGNSGGRIACGEIVKKS